MRLMMASQLFIKVFAPLLWVAFCGHASGQMAPISQEEARTVDTALQRAEKQLRSGDPAGARQVLEPILSLVHKANVPGRIRSQAFHMYGAALHGIGRDEEAVPYMFKACEGCVNSNGTVDPGMMNVLVDIAGMLGTLKRDAFGVQLLDLAYERKADFPKENRLNLCIQSADVYLRLRQFEKSLHRLRDCLALDAPIEIFPSVAGSIGLQIRARLIHAQILWNTDGPKAAQAVADRLLGELDALSGLDDEVKRNARVGWDIVRYRLGDQSVGKNLKALFCNPIPIMDAAATYRDMQNVGNCGSLLSDSGDTKAAREKFELFVRIAERLRASSSLSEKERLSSFSESVGAYHRFVGQLISEGDATRAFQVSELAKGRNLSDSLRSAKVLEDLAKKSAEVNRILVLNTEIRDIEERIARAYADPLVKLRLEVLKAPKTLERNELYASTTGKYPELSKAETPITAEDVRRKIGKDSLYFSLVAVKDGLAGFVVTDKGLIEARVVSLPRWFAKTVEAYRVGMSARDIKHLKDPKGSGEFRSIVARGACEFELVDDSELFADGTEIQESLQPIQRCLSEFVLAPFQKALSSRKNWIVSTDSALARVPFETLTIGGNWVVDTYSLNYVPSWRTHVALTERAASRKKTGRIFAIGDVTYPGACDAMRGVLPLGVGLGEAREFVPPSFSSLNKLCNSRREVEGVAREFGDKSAVFTGREATLDSIDTATSKKGLDSFQFVLISAHGFEHPHESNLSAVFLAPNGGESSGELTAAAIRRKGLRSELVYLSACDTGLGQIVTGEGVLGLPQALLESGSTSAVLALWPVPDDSAAEFSVRFFKRIRQGKSPIDALSGTKREFRSGVAGPDWQLPMHWAPFVLVGG